MKTLFKISIVTAILALTIEAHAQQKQENVQRGYVRDYSTGIGLRVGLESGLTIKHFVSDRAAIEGIIGTGYRGLLITGLYELQTPAFNAAHLNWFYGVGGHVGFFEGKYYDVYYVYRGDVYEVRHYVRTDASIGIDGILGLEYYIGEIPFTLGIDIKPFIDFTYPVATFFDGAFTIRFVF